MVSHVHRLECVSIPMTEREINAFDRLMETWEVTLPFFNRDSHPNIDLLITVSCGYSVEVNAEIIDILKRRHIFGRFRDVNVSFLSIPLEEDIYLRAGEEWLGPTPLPRYGLKNGPNAQFFQTLRLCSKYNTILLSETDLYPIRTDWLARSAAIISEMSHFLVCGGCYSGARKISSSFERHLNGNAFYATGHTGFQHGLLPAWEKGLALLCTSMPSAAYDIWLAHTYHNLLFGPVQELSNNNFFKEISRYFYLSVDKSLFWNASLPGDSLGAEMLEALSKAGYIFVHGRNLINPAREFILK